jgi:hypothetical protein
MMLVVAPQNLLSLSHSLSPNLTAPAVGHKRIQCSALVSGCRGRHSNQACYAWTKFRLKGALVNFRKLRGASRLSIDHDVPRTELLLPHFGQYQYQSS